MRKEYLLIGIMMIFVLAVSACTPQQAPQDDQQQATQDDQAAPDEQGADAQVEANVNVGASVGSDISLSNLYNYNLVHSYEYKLTASYGGQETVSNLKYDITADTLDGTAAWKLNSNIESQGATIETTTWLDKSTYSCLKISTSMNIAGQTINNEADCPEVGPNAAASSGNTASGDAMLNYVGEESITVPAGTFNAKKYSYSGVDYWIGTDVPLPLKVTYSGQGASSVMELVSYS